ncbi:unnamed protein product [Rhizoctonia solani]|uniref:Protein kinase domain-containing protein n=1 Tax=Rhizoctonia solani TaxID=456999 RepID=A0A8H3A139_9AGAM|nr:unnamed protein product [Rhizoctonia solani]
MDPNAYSKGYIATGGFGDIWKGELHDETAVAIKVWRFRALNEDPGKDIKCIQVAQGVEYLHNSNMIHGDLKAINVLVSPDHKLKLTDFDYSIMAESTLQFSQTTRMGGGTLRLQN